MITVLWSLYYDHCTMITLLWSLYYDHCTMITVLLSLYYDHFTMITALWSLYYDHFTMITLLWSLYYDHCTMITVLWSLYYDHCTMITLLWSLYYDHSTMILKQVNNNWLLSLYFQGGKWVTWKTDILQLIIVTFSRKWLYCLPSLTLVTDDLGDLGQGRNLQKGFTLKQPVYLLTNFQQRISPTIIGHHTIPSVCEFCGDWPMT